MKRLFQATLATILLVTATYACQVPVFRYALEQWSSDNYEILVLHDEPLSQQDQARIDAIWAKTTDPKRIANVKPRTLSVSELRAPSSLTQNQSSGENVFSNDDPVAHRQIANLRLAALWKQHGKSGGPIVLLLYPPQAEEVPDRVVQVIPLNAFVAESVVNSPARKQVTERLLAGDSAVWIFVPCGDEQQDRAGLETLRKQVQLDQSRLSLPSAEEMELSSVLIEAADIELRLGFSIVTVKRDDAREQFLLNSLLRSESDLETIQQPMAFPVLGRGRVLYALVGKGISPDTIAIASSFIVGPCSCQVKDLNPGFDLLLSVDWEKELRGSKLSTALPEPPLDPVLLTIPPGRQKR
ncbi:hypothetical protein [Novipirellula artificiosorum]|nr:hypothetical protein [Novipirellula artificiosorum]